MMAMRTNQNTKGEPLGGKTPASRNITGRGEPMKAMKPRMIAPRFFPRVRVTIGAKTAPMTAETKTLEVTRKFSNALKAQK